MRLSEIAALLRPGQTGGLEPGADGIEVTDLAFDSRRTRRPGACSSAVLVRWTTVTATPRPLWRQERLLWWSSGNWTLPSPNWW